MKRITKLRRSVKAVSPIISVLLMIAIAVSAALVAYAWVSGYMDFTTTKVGKSIQIQSISTTSAYVQNVGDSAVTLESLYVDGDLATDADFDPIDLEPSETSEVTTASLSWADASRVTIKIVTTDGISAEMTKTFSSFTSDITPENQAPTADFSYVVDYLDVDFTDASTDSDGTVVAWSWTFGDGETSVLQNPSHTYATEDTFTVTLTVADNDGATDDYTTTVTTSVENQPPTAMFTYLPTDPEVDESVAFTDESTDSDGTVDEWSWTFGDGTTSTLQNPTHTYTTEDTFTVTLTVTDDDGATDDYITTVTTSVANQPPTADFSYVVDYLDVDFTDESTDSDGTVDEWSWTFGDGATSTQQNPSHTYATADTYTVTLTVTDDDGATDDYSTTVTVTAPIQPVTFVSSGTGSWGSGSGSSNNPSPSYPTSLATDDLILLQVSVRDSSNTPSTPSGFTLLFGPDTAGYGYGQVRQWIYYKFSDGTESGSLTVTVGGSSTVEAQMYAFRNVALTSFTEGANVGSGYGSTISAESVTTTGEKRLAVSFVYITDNINIGDFTGETGGNWAEQSELQANPSGSYDATIQLQTATLTTAGTISGGSVSTGYTNVNWVVRAFALIPRS